MAISVYHGFYLPSAAAFAAPFLACTIVACLPWDAGCDEAHACGAGPLISRVDTGKLASP